MSSPCVDVLFIQGAGRGAHAADRAVSDALGRALGDGYRVHFPHMPAEDAPDNDVWKRAISTALRRTRSTFLVAHSAGDARGARRGAAMRLASRAPGYTDEHTMSCGTSEQKNAAIHWFHHRPSPKGRRCPAGQEGLPARQEGLKATLRAS